MTAEQFTYWMQGFAELSGDESPTAAQWKSMREHLALVFKKVTPTVIDTSKFGPAVPYTPMPNIVIPHIHTAAPTPPRPWDYTTVTC